MTALLAALEELAGSDVYPLHMPGHKRNLQGVSEVLAQAAGLDITEIDGFDNLYAPEGILKEALGRAAALYGADETLYSVNGSTGALLTALSAAVPEGGKLILARNCHRAVWNNVYLRHLEPVYLYPEVLPDISLAAPVRPQAVEKALCAHPDAKAVLIVSPTYDGLCADVEGIARVVHAHGAVLIVDGAHGAHFGFDRGFPPNPVRLGADLTVMSLHKTLPAMTQTALLHRKGERVESRRLQMFYGMYQTSSPSYFLMAGIDSCIGLLAREGAGLWEGFWQERTRFLKKTAGLKNLRLLTAGQMPPGCDWRMDPGKLLIFTAQEGLTGKQIYDILLEKYHIQPEMAAGRYVTAILTCCDDRRGWERLSAALLEMDTLLEAEGPNRRPTGLADRLGKESAPYPVPGKGISLREALDRPREHCTLEEAIGRAAAVFVNLYPPGIPIVAPGEILTEEIVAQLQYYIREALPLQGADAEGIDVVSGMKIF